MATKGSDIHAQLCTERNDIIKCLSFCLDMTIVLNELSISVFAPSLEICIGRLISNSLSWAMDTSRRSTAGGGAGEYKHVNYVWCS